MQIRMFVRSALSVGFAVLVASSQLACSSTPPPKDVVQVQAGAMPEGGSWEGVYFNPVYGELHITVSGGAMQGAWRTVTGDRWGEMYGELEGDTVRFSWTEYKIGVVGPNAKSDGKGFFKYTIPTPGEAHELKGEWGLGEGNAGHTWKCVKMMNKEPDPKSQRPNEMENQVGAEGFDGSKGDSRIKESDEKKEGAEEKKAPAEE